LQNRLRGPAGRRTGKRRLLAACAATQPKIIILTTFDLDEYVYDALVAGACGFLLKDVRAEQRCRFRVAHVRLPAVPRPERRREAESENDPLTRLPFASTGTGDADPAPKRYQVLGGRKPPATSASNSAKVMTVSSS
jgi:hypothetical protein